MKRRRKIYLLLYSDFLGGTVVDTRLCMKYAFEIYIAALFVLTCLGMELSSSHSDAFAMAAAAPHSPYYASANQQ